MCVALVVSLTKEMTAQSIAYHAIGTAEPGVTNSTVIHGLCAMTKQISGALHAQARPHDVNLSD